ncbi:MAG: hypothetical protein RLZZ596_1390 [Pseudomonadota bacterium]|jgi:uncharacterized protein (DUF934 family)
MIAMKIISSQQQTLEIEHPKVLQLANDLDPREVPLDGIDRIDLHFPKFTDGRAFSQAYLLRRRLGFSGEIRATGDVLLDQLLQMARCGFNAAVLRCDQDLLLAEHALNQFGGFYQADNLPERVPATML